MKKIFVITMLGFFIANIASAIVLGSFQRSYFERFYDANETYEELNMSKSDLMMATDRLLDYIVGKEESLEFDVVVANQQTQMFNEKEIEHMIDVKTLYNAMVVVQYVGYGMFLLSIIIGLAIYKKKLFPILLEASKKALVFLLVIIVGIGLMAIIDFNSFWNAFHKVLFTNDLWLLNPATDRMIVMVPLHFFQQLVARIVLYWLISVALWMLLVKGLSLRSEL